MNKRMKVYGIAIPIFLVLSLILGSLAYVGGEMYRDSYFKAGWITGAEYGYMVGMQTGYQYGLWEGYYAGQTEGYYQGKLDGYVETAMNWDNPWHQAALAIEREFLAIDVAGIFSVRVSTTTDVGRETHDEVWVYIAIPVYVEEGVVKGYTLEMLDEQLPEFTAALIREFSKVITTESVISFRMLGSFDSMTPQAYWPYDSMNYTTDDFLAGAWDQGTRNEAQEDLRANAFSQAAAKNLFPWPWNPFYLAELQAAQETRAGAGEDPEPK